MGRTKSCACSTCRGVCVAVLPCWLTDWLTDWYTHTDWYTVGGRMACPWPKYKYKWRAYMTHVGLHTQVIPTRHVYMTLYTRTHICNLIRELYDMPTEHIVDCTSWTGSTATWLSQDTSKCWVSAHQSIRSLSAASCCTVRWACHCACRRAARYCWWAFVNLLCFILHSFNPFKSTLW